MWVHLSNYWFHVSVFLPLFLIQIKGRGSVWILGSVSSVTVALQQSLWAGSVQRSLALASLAMYEKEKSRYAKKNLRLEIPSHMINKSSICKLQLAITGEHPHRAPVDGRIHQISYHPLSAATISGTCPGKKKFTRRCCSPSDSCLARCQAPNSIGSLKHAKLGHCQIMWLLCSETEVLSCSMKDERLQAPVPTCSCSWSSCNGMVWWHPCTAPREPHHNLPPIPNQLQQVRWLEKSVWTNSIYLLIYLCRHWTSTGNHAESQQFYSQKSERAHSKACLPNIDLLLGCILFLIFNRFKSLRTGPSWTIRHLSLHVNPQLRILAER